MAESADPFRAQRQLERLFPGGVAGTQEYRSFHELPNSQSPEQVDLNDCQVVGKIIYNQDKEEINYIPADKEAKK